MNTLTFSNIVLHPIIQDNQIWLTSTELAQALGYKNSKSVSNLYNSNIDEFTSKMTLVIESVTKGFGNGNSKKAVRIFSLRGCHLIAMFARTKVAKDFRKWVLDILDNELMPASHTRKDQRCSIHQAASLLMCKSNLNLPEVWEILHQRFNVNSIKQIPLEQIPEAVSYLHWLASHTESQPNPTQQAGMWIDEATVINTRALITHTAWQLSFWWHIRDAIRTLNPATYATASSHFANVSLGIYSLANIYGVPINKQRLQGHDWTTLSVTY